MGYSRVLTGYPRVLTGYSGPSGRRYDALIGDATAAAEAARENAELRQQLALAHKVRGRRISRAKALCLYTSLLLSLPLPPSLSLLLLSLSTSVSRSLSLSVPHSPPLRSLALSVPATHLRHS